MCGKANCDDDSVVESFFKSLKAELVWHRNWQTRRKVEIALSHGLTSNHCRATEHINGFYNPRHRHAAIGWKSPVAFEKQPS
jgi:putative transposase